MKEIERGSERGRERVVREREGGNERVRRRALEGEVETEVRRRDMWKDDIG